MVKRSALAWLIPTTIVLCCFCVVLARPYPVAADEGKSGDVSALVARVDPCVVTIKMQHSQGSGFVVDAEGIIATNYHVIEGAREATVVFPNKETYPVKGFMTIIPNKDMALLRIDTRGKRFPVLSLADKLPAKGERVFAFGAPLGMSGSVSEGIVAALRGGEEVRGILREASSKDIYTEVLGYDTDIQWIQTTTPISPGNSGGPLVNAQGEVVGINTWQNRIGQNLNFSISISHLRDLISSAGHVVQSLSMLPPARHRDAADSDKTLAVWKKLNRLKNELNGKMTASEKRIAAIAPADPRNPLKGYNARMKKKAGEYHTLGQAFSDFAAKVKGIKTTGIDTNLLIDTIAEADLAQRASDVCQKISAAAAAQSEPEVFAGEVSLRQNFQRVAANLRTAHDLLRAGLSEQFHKEFPTLEETASQPEADDETESPKGEAKSSPTSDHPELRDWTDSTGRYHIKAKFHGIEDGKAVLEQSDGTRIKIAVQKLSEADQAFVADKK